MQKATAKTVAFFEPADYCPRLETNRTSGGAGSLQPKAEGSAKSEAESSATFEKTVTSHPTSSYP